MDERKLIAHGKSSLTLALPHKWIKKYKLHKGDKVSVKEDDKGLRINPKPFEKKKKIKVDLSKLDWPVIVTILTTIYRRGYDEVITTYEKSEEYQHISTSIRSLLGYAIVENLKGECIIKSLPSELEQDFLTLFRRVFLILLQQMNDLKEILSSPKELKNFYHRDADLNSIVNLAIRMINKGQVEDRFEELYLFHALLILEESGDDLTRFTIEICNYKDAAKLKDAVDKCAIMLRLLYDAYFTKKKGITDFYKQYYLYWPDAKKMPAPFYDFFIKSKHKRAIFYLRCIIEKIVNLAEVLLQPEAKIENM